MQKHLKQKSFFVNSISPKEKAAAVFIFTVLTVLYFASIATHPLLEPDEGRYAEIPREMNESGNYITPRLNYVEYFEKPAMLYWANAISFKIFGETEFAARFFNAFSAVAGIAVTGLLGAFMYGIQPGLFASIITGTSLLYFAIGTINLTDMPLSFFITLSLASFYIGYSSRHRRWYAAFYAAMALGLLTKGLVAVVLPCGVIFWFAVFTKKLRPIKDILYIPGILIFFAISVPWFYMVCQDNPDFFRFFFIQEHFMRYATKIHDRYEPFWYFMPIILAGLMPWCGFLVTLPRKTGILRSPDSPEMREANLFLLLWFGVILVFFSVSSSKLIPYVVPCIPPLGLLIAADMKRRTASDAGSAAFIVNAAINILFSAALFYYAIFGKEIERTLALGIAAFTSFPLLFGAALSLKYRFGKSGRNIKKALAALALSAMVFVAGVQMVYIPISNDRSIAHVAEAVMNIKHKNERIAVYGEVLQAMPFYTKERVILIDYTGELAYGASMLENAEREKWFPSADEFLKAWDGNEPLVLIVKKKRINDLFKGDPRGVTYKFDYGKYSIFFNGDARRGFQ